MHSHRNETAQRRDVSDVSRRPRVIWALLPLLATLLLGCTQKDQEKYPHSWAGSECTDNDQDGFGAGCEPGADCDDGDASTTNGCYYCLDHDPGCPCDIEGQRESCGVVTNSAGGHIVCGYGERVCAGGEWAECIVNNSVKLGASAEPGAHPQTLGNASPCINNPCSLYCQEFADDATGLSGGNGIEETDDGLSITPDEEPTKIAFCFGGSQGTCSHSVCTPGKPLASSCDTKGPPEGVTHAHFSETFANNAAGWTLGSEWGIGPASVSTGHTLGNPDPKNDRTPTIDNGVAGTVIGGNVSSAQHGFAWLTSPVINLSGITETVTLSFSRWLNMAAPPASVARVQVLYNATWHTVQSIDVAVAESGWNLVKIDVSAYISSTFKVRFGYAVQQASNHVVSGWNIDDVKLASIGPVSLPSTSCVQKVCNVDPTCCLDTWSQVCVAHVHQHCGMKCATVAGTCTLCYYDGVDHDGDGYSWLDGDCLDCDSNVNPGAFDFPDNGLDEDCSGTADDEPAGCDSALTMTSSVALDHAKAIDLCRTTTDGATKAQKTWGVIDAKLVQADGVSVPHATSYGILSRLGPHNLPFEGAKMAAFSSGTARAPGDPGYVNPNGQVASFNQGKACAFPSGFPKNGEGCPSPSPGSSYAYDSSGLWLKMRVPTNALSMSYKFNFFSSEYPEWVCSYFNDSFVGLLTSSYQPANPPENSGNISFDANSDPVTVNVSFFNVVGGTKLGGTGFDGSCDGQVCGGATDWLQSTAPVMPGETLTLQLALWDTGDHGWDSTVLVDDFRWALTPATIRTFVPEEPSGSTYTAASFTRDYDVSNACPAGTSVSWGLWSWSATTPSDSRIDFYVQTAATSAGLLSAPSDPMQFTNPPGPSSLVGTHARAKAGVPDTQGGSAMVDTTLKAMGRARGEAYLRVTSTLVPSSDSTRTPTLTTWNQQFSCEPSE